MFEAWMPLVEELVMLNTVSLVILSFHVTPIINLRDQIANILLNSACCSSSMRDNASSR